MSIPLSQIISSQSKKFVTANAAHGQLNGALSNPIAVDFSGDADVTLVATDAHQNMVFKVTGAITATRNMIVPVDTKLYIVINNTTGGFAVTVKTAAGTGISVASATTRILFCDGTNVIAIT